MANGGDDPIPLDAETRAVIKMLRDIAKRCQQIMLHPPSSTESGRAFQSSRAAQMLAGINRELEAVKQRLVNVAAKKMVAAYQQGLIDAEKQAMEAGVLEDRSALRGSFTAVDTRRARVLAQQAVNDLTQAVVSIRENTGKIVRKCQALGIDNAKINLLLAGGTIEGVPLTTLNQLRVEIRKLAIDGNIVTVNTKTGVVMHFKPDDYADLVFQTKQAETTTVATMERLQARGLFYVKVIGSLSRNFCTAYVGRVFYIGPGEDPTGQFPSSRELPRGGPPFHPRCSKRFVAFILDLASPAQIKDATLRPHERDLLGKPSSEVAKIVQARMDKADAAKRQQAAADEPVSVTKAKKATGGEKIRRPR